MMTMVISATELFNYAVQTFEETFIPKLREWGLKVQPAARQGDDEIGWVVESKSRYQTRIFIVLYERLGIGIFESGKDRTMVRIYDDWVKAVWKRHLAVIGKAILRLSGKELERACNISYSLFMESGMTLKLPKGAKEKYLSEIFAYFKIAPTKLTWRWKISVYNDKKSVIHITETKAGLKDPIEAYLQAIKLVLAEALL
jgi:hypothetical protein